MGLSTKEVSGDHGLDWSQSLLQSGTWELPKPPSTRRQQQQTEPTLECPRCGSANTKFCYYNNYNKLQPRHFCKACKRHWTEGGTLRNIPVGGGRKNKRLKASNTVIKTAPTSTSASTTSHANMGNKSLQRRQNLSLPLANQKDLSNPVYQSLISPQSSVPFDAMNSINNSHNKTAFLGDLGDNGNSTMSSSSLLSSFDTGPSSIMSSCQSLNAYNYLRKLETLEDSTITTTNTTMPSTTCSILSEPWHVPTMSTIVADVPSYWNWNDIDSLVSAELSIPWDEAEIKP